MNAELFKPVLGFATIHQLTKCERTQVTMPNTVTIGQGLLKTVATGIIFGIK